MHSRFVKGSIASCLFIGIAGAIFYFMFRIVVSDWHAIVSYPWKISWFSIVPSVITAIISMLLAIKAAHKLCIGFGEAISFSRFVYIFCISQLGRYLPGRFWHFLGFVMLLERQNIRRSVSVILPFLFQGLMVAVYWVIGAIMSGALVDSIPLPDAVWLLRLSTGAIVTGLVFLPFLLKKVPFRRDSHLMEVRRSGLSQKSYYGAVGLLALSGLALGGAFFLFLSGLVEVPIRGAPFFGGTFLFSYVIGWLVFIAPGGLGPREGALAFLLAPHVSSGVGSIAALSARLWMTGAECILVLGVWIWMRFVRGEDLGFVKSTSDTDRSAV